MVRLATQSNLGGFQEMAKLASQSSLGGFQEVWLGLLRNPTRFQENKNHVRREHMKAYIS